MRRKYYAVGIWAVLELLTSVDYCYVLPNA